MKGKEKQGYTIGEIAQQMYVSQMLMVERKVFEHEGCMEVRGVRKGSLPITVAVAIGEGPRKWLIALVNEICASDKGAIDAGDIKVRAKEESR